MKIRKYIIIYLAIIFYSSKLIGQTISIEDDYLRNYLIANFDTNDDKQIQRSEALKIEYIEINADSIISFQVIHELKNLKVFKSFGIYSLENRNNQFRTFDFSANTHINEIWFINNLAFELELNDCKDLNEIRIVNTKLKNIDISSNVNLKHLEIMGDYIQDVDITNNTNLENIHLKNIGNSKLDLSQHYKLKQISISNTNINELCLENNAALEMLSCINNELLSNISFSEICILESIECWGSKKLKSIDLGGLKTLRRIELLSNNINEIILPKSKNLLSLILLNNCIKELDLSNFSKLTTLKVGHNPIKQLDLTTLPNLKRVNLVSTLLQKIDFSKNSELSSLELRKNENLKELNIIDTSIKSDILLSDCPNLEVVYLNSSQLEIIKKRVGIKSKEINFIHDNEGKSR